MATPYLRLSNHALRASAIDTTRGGNCGSVEPSAVCSTLERTQHAQGLHRAAEASGDRTSQC